MKKNNSAREVDDQHHRLVEAIINGDAEQAERCMSEHMDTIERYMEEMQKKILRNFGHFTELIDMTSIVFCNTSDIIKM